MAGPSVVFPGPPSTSFPGVSPASSLSLSVKSPFSVSPIPSPVIIPVKEDILDRIRYLDNLKARVVFESNRELFDISVKDLPPVPYIQNLSQEYKCDAAPIGQGSYGVVMKCQKDPSSFVAVKKFSDSCSWRIELEILSKLNSSYIAKMLFIGKDKTPTSSRYVIGLEYVDGVTLDDYILRMESTKRVVDPNLQASIVLQTLSGIEDLINAGFADCDLKPENIMIARNGDVKIIDLGGAEKLGVERYYFIATPTWREPQFILDDGETQVASDKTDIWSLGAIILRMSSSIYYYDVHEIEANKLMTSKQKVKNIRDILDQLQIKHVEKYNNTLCDIAFNQMLVYDRDRRGDVHLVFDLVRKSFPGIIV